MWSGGRRWRGEEAEGESRKEEAGGGLLPHGSIEKKK